VQIWQESFTDECDVFCRLARSVCNAIVTAGVGQVCDSLDDLQSSYAGARSAVSYRLLYGTGRAINISEIAPQESGASFETDSEELHDVFKAIRMHDADSVTAAVSQYLSGSTANLKSIQEYRFFVMELVSELYRFARSNQLDQEEVFQEHDDILQTVQRMEKDDLQKWLSDICIRMQEMIQKKRLDTTKSFVTKAMEYVDEHYGDVDLNVDSICTTLGVSSAYFSTVFKKETGKTFINYLTELRMNKAVHLLNEKDEKTYIIAQQVGYSDPNYFSYVFKKQFGVSPSKYKTGK
jgi:two-component system response regulator YesN